MKVLLAAIVLLALGVAYADDHRFPMDMDDLGLTPKQHKAVEAAMKEYQHAYRLYHVRSEKEQEEFNRLFAAPVFNEAAFRALSLERARASAEIRTRLFARLHGILTPEQKRRFIRHIEEWDIE